MLILEQRGCRQQRLEKVGKHRLRQLQKPQENYDDQNSFQNPGSMTDLRTDSRPDLHQEFCGRRFWHSCDSNATDKAMIKVVPRTGNDYKAMREKHLPDGYVRFPFTSKRKKMSTVLENIDDNEFGYDKRLHVKGAAEQILKLCSHWLNEDGQKEELSDDKKKEINDHVIEKYAENALRTICCAYKDLRDGEGGATHENDASDGFNKEIELSGLTFICVLGIKDIIRPEVPQAVEDCFNAQVRVRMVTGDNKITAMAIAKECNLITEKKDYSVLEG